MSSPNTPLAQAQATWMGICAGGPYTSLMMVQHLMSAGGKTTKGFLTNPKVELKGTTALLEGKTLAQLAPTWQLKTGRCTSFAVKAVNDLKEVVDSKNVPVFNFEVFDIGRHRIARCTKTGILIDSSSTGKGGAFVLAPEKWYSFPETNASWKYCVKDRKSKFERDGNADPRLVKVAAEPISDERAMLICLDEVEQQAERSVPTLFRSVDAERQAVFHGMVFWNLKDHALELVQDLATKRKMIVQWPKNKKDAKGRVTGLDLTMQGTPETLGACIEAVAQFVKVYGGPFGETQWLADGINTISEGWFQGACELWGCPKLVV